MDQDFQGREVKHVHAATVRPGNFGQTPGEFSRYFEMVNLPLESGLLWSEEIQRKVQFIDVALERFPPMTPSGGAGINSPLLACIITELQSDFGQRGLPMLAQRLVTNANSRGRECRRTHVSNDVIRMHESTNMLLASQLEGSIRHSNFREG